MGSAASKQFQSDKAKHAQIVLSAVQNFEDSRNGVNMDMNEGQDGFSADFFKKRVLLAASDAKARGKAIDSSLAQLTDADIETLRHYVVGRRDEEQKKSVEESLRVEEVNDEDVVAVIRRHKPPQGGDANNDETTSVLSYGDHEDDDEEEDAHDESGVDSSGSMLINRSRSRSVHASFDQDEVENLETEEEGSPGNIRIFPISPSSKHGFTGGESTSERTSHTIDPGDAGTGGGSRKLSLDGDQSTSPPLFGAHGAHGVPGAHGTRGGMAAGHRSGVAEAISKIWGDMDAELGSVASQAGRPAFSPSASMQAFPPYRGDSGGGGGGVGRRMGAVSPGGGGGGSGYKDRGQRIDEDNASLMGLQRQKVMTMTQNAQLEREVEALQKQLERMDQMDQVLGFSPNTTPAKQSHPPRGRPDDGHLPVGGAPSTVGSNSNGNVLTGLAMRKLPHSYIYPIEEDMSKPFEALPKGNAGGARGAGRGVGRGGGGGGDGSDSDAKPNASPSSTSNRRRGKVRRGKAGTGAAAAALNNVVDPRHRHHVDSKYGHGYGQGPGQGQVGASVDSGGEEALREPPALQISNSRARRSMAKAGSSSDSENDVAANQSSMARMNNMYSNHKYNLDSKHQSGGGGSGIGADSDTSDGGPSVGHRAPGKGAGSHNPVRAGRALHDGSDLSDDTGAGSEVAGHKPTAGNHSRYRRRLGQQQGNAQGNNNGNSSNGLTGRNNNNSSPGSTQQQDPLLLGGVVGIGSGGGGAGGQGGQGGPSESRGVLQRGGTGVARRRRAGSNVSNGAESDDSSSVPVGAAIGGVHGHGVGAMRNPAPPPQQQHLSQQNSDSENQHHQGNKAHGQESAAGAAAGAAAIPQSPRAGPRGNAVLKAALSRLNSHSEPNDTVGGIHSQDELLNINGSGLSGAAPAPASALGPSSRPRRATKGSATDAGPPSAAAEEKLPAHKHTPPPVKLSLDLPVSDGSGGGGYGGGGRRDGRGGGERIYAEDKAAEYRSLMDNIDRHLGESRDEQGASAQPSEAGAGAGAKEGGGGGGGGLAAFGRVKGKGSALKKLNRRRHSLDGLDDTDDDATSPKGRQQQRRTRRTIEKESPHRRPSNAETVAVTASAASAAVTAGIGVVGSSTLHHTPSSDVMDHPDGGLDMIAEGDGGGGGGGDGASPTAGRSHMAAKAVLQARRRRGRQISNASSAASKAAAVAAVAAAGGGGDAKTENGVEDVDAAAAAAAESAAEQRPWTSKLEHSWAEVSLLLRKPIKTEEDMMYTVAAAEAGLMFTDQMNAICKTLNVLRGTLSRWVLPFDNNTRIESQCSTPHSVVENMPDEFKGKLTERQVHYLVAGANGVRKLVRVKIADDNDLEQARNALKTTAAFFKSLYERAERIGISPYELLQQGEFGL